MIDRYARGGDFYYTPLPKTLQKLAERDDRIECIEKVDDSHCDTLRYYVCLKPGYRWQGYYTSGKNFATVSDVMGFLYAIEPGETQ